MRQKNPLKRGRRPSCDIKLLTVTAKVKNRKRGLNGNCVEQENIRGGMGVEVIKEETVSRRVCKN